MCGYIQLDNTTRNKYEIAICVPFMILVLGLRRVFSEIEILMVGHLLYY